MLLFTAAMFTAGCSSPPNVQRATLRCKAFEGQCISFYSFKAGVLTPPVEPEQVDIVYYFDNDDCFQGALLGRDDRPGYLFPIGYKSWPELEILSPPSQNGESIAAIKLAKENEGLAFWVKTGRDDYVPVRIKTIHPATYADLVSGGTASMEMEWLEPQRE